MEDKQQEQFQYVYAWLKAKFGDKPIPRFEITPHTLSTLYQLAQINVSRDADVDLMLQDATYYTQEYKQQGLRVQGILRELGVDLGQIDSRSSGHACSTSLVSLASTMQLKDTQNSSYFVGINEMRQEGDKLTHQQFTERQVLKDLLSKTTMVVQRIAELKQVLEQVEEQALIAQHTTSLRTAEISYLASKAEEYKETLENNSKVEVDPRLTHEYLVGTAEGLSQLQTITNQVQTVLASYNDLPPDISLAKLKIEEARANLANLEERLSAKLGAII